MYYGYNFVVDEDNYKVYLNISANTSVDAFITYQNKTKIKLKEIKIKYCISKPITTIFTIDAMNIFHGVIEYLSKNSKKFVSKDGKTKDIL